MEGSYVPGPEWSTKYSSPLPTDASFGESGLRLKILEVYPACQ